MPRKDPRVTTQLGGVRKPGTAGNCAALSSALAMTERIRSNTKLKLWRTESLAQGTKLKLLLMPRLKRRDHSAGPGQEVGRAGEKSAVQIGTELLLHGTSYTVSGPPCHASAAAVRSLIVRPGQDPNRADFKFGNTR
jgi:hypothetical protein